jgi:hypothetical protein
MNENWIVGEPGGPAGPFWGVVTSRGRSIALQVATKRDAKIIAIVGSAIEGDFDTVRQVSEQLQNILERDFDNKAHFPIKEGGFDYVVRSVFEAIERVKYE